MNKQLIISVIAGLLVGGGVGYYLPHTAQASSATGSTRFGGAGGAFSRGGGFSRGGQAGSAQDSFLAGTVAKTSSGSITLNLRDGSSKVILLTPATTVSKSVVGSPSDVTTGSDIIVNGTTNSDGSVSASLIQIRPATPAATAGAPMIPAK